MQSNNDTSILVFGYGNPGRQDDGLGPFIAEQIDSLDIDNVETDAAYQLNIEDAAEIAKYDLVVFVDATIEEGTESFSVRRLFPACEVTFTSHHIGPESVLAVCQDTFGRVPEALLIGIRGYEFHFREGLTKAAQKNGRKALEFITLLIQEYKGNTMATNSTDQKTILIIDDDPDIRAAIRIVLESAGFSVGEAADGEEGVKIAQRIKPDAIIVDLMMETVDAGSKVSQLLTESGFEGPIYLLSSAGDTVRYNIDAKELGLAGIFQKPIDHEVLLKTLKTRLKVR